MSAFNDRSKCEPGATRLLPAKAEHRPQWHKYTILDRTPWSGEDNGGLLKKGGLGLVRLIKQGSWMTAP
ncbi:MAG: hypothetical protein R6U32_07795 [Candidatus Woesearchaeota archaeon]